MIALSVAVRKHFSLCRFVDCRCASIRLFP
jgi:hypothetical protein